MVTLKSLSSHDKVSWLSHFSPLVHFPNTIRGSANCPPQACVVPQQGRVTMGYSVTGVYSVLVYSPGIKALNMYWEAGSHHYYLYYDCSGIGQSDRSIAGHLHLALRLLHIPILTSTNNSNLAKYKYVTHHPHITEPGCLTFSV